MKKLDRLLRLEAARVLLVESQGLSQKAANVLRDINELSIHDNGKSIIDSQNTIDRVLRYIVDEQSTR